MRSRVLLGGMLAAVLLVGLLIGLLSRSGAGAPSTAAPSVGATRDPESGLPLVALAALPAEARQTVITIERGGPFRYTKDGAVFGNLRAAAADQAARVLSGVHRADSRGGRPRAAPDRHRRPRSTAVLHR